MFNSPYSRNKSVYSYNKSGNGSVKSWELLFLPNGDKSFVRSEAKPLYDVIQSFKDECDIKTIVSRCLSRNGSLDVLKADPKRSLDYRYFPTNIKDYQEFINQSKDSFEKLNSSYKANFASFSEFLTSPDNVGKFYSIMADKYKNLAPKDIIKKEGV